MNAPAIFDKNGKIRVRQFTLNSFLINLVFWALILGSILGLFLIDYEGKDLFAATIKALDDFKVMFGNPQVGGDGSILSFLRNLRDVGITLALAFLTTLIGGIIALGLGLLAAKNLSSKLQSTLIKQFVAFIRAVPTELWVFIFAIGAGLGSVAAVVGMTFHTIGHLIKSYSEAFEEIDEGVIEALKASGANWLQIVFQAVLPSSLTYILSWTFVRFEINFVIAVAMGAAAGAGGIGFELSQSAYYYANMKRVGAVALLILAVTAILETIAVKLKEKFHLQG